MMSYETEPTEPLEVFEDRPPVNPNHPPHVFVPSEFPEGRARGRCDLCGGGAAHEIHQIRVDPLVRIADALERLSLDLDRLADVAERPYRTGAWWRLVEWVQRFFAPYTYKGPRA